MPTLRIEHHVANYAGWKKAFDDDPIGRARSGVLRYSILRGADNPNDVMIDLDFASKEEAEGLLAAMRQVWGRVQGTLIFEPRAQIVETVETKEY
ncbi:MAG TPA: hypothetical protein VKX16_07830 [Chloroflexota bacterium]|nr:hypothetical protein [Chloroflexota bacterium]